MPRGKTRRNSGKDKISSETKVSQESKGRHIVVLFADIAGCSEISNHKDLAEYNEFINTFQKLFRAVCDFYKDQRYEDHEKAFFQREAREGCLKIFTSQSIDSLPRDIDTAINIAFDLKRMWLFTDYNRKRIENDGLLPVDIGIGIHAGKVYINKDKNGYRPEGYAINLSKRVESASRDGKFSHILLSEAARGRIHNLKDEDTYLFNDPFAMKPKGISQDVKVFEIKHHFLGTGWDRNPTEASILYEDIGDVNVEIVKKAYEANPTNLWLAEEHVQLTVMNEFKKLCKKGKQEDIIERAKVFEPAADTARRIANSDLRDAGTLGVWGFVLGEQGKYEEEQDKYKEALELDAQNGNINWYVALSISYELYDLQDQDTDIKEFFKYNKTKISKALKAFKKATELKPFQPWIVYDYACELSWWSQADGSLRSKAIDKLVDAFTLNSDTQEFAQDEEYLEIIIEDPKITKHL